MNFYQVKIVYLLIVEDKSIFTSKEVIVSADNYTAAETQATQIIEDEGYEHGKVSDIKKYSVSGIVFTQDAEDDEIQKEFFYKCKTSYLADVGGKKPKKITENWLVSADNLLEANKLVLSHNDSSMDLTVEVEEIKKTKIVDTY